MYERSKNGWPKSVVQTFKKQGTRYSTNLNSENLRFSTDFNTRSFIGYFHFQEKRRNHNYVVHLDEVQASTFYSIVYLSVPYV